TVRAGVGFGDSAANLRIQIAPVRIGFLDELDLPRPLPRLDRLFAADGGFHRLMHFEPDEVVYAMTPSEALGHAVSVLPDTRRKVGSDADIQRAIEATGEQV